MDARLGVEPSTGLFSANVAAVRTMAQDRRWLSGRDVRDMNSAVASLYRESGEVWKQRLRLRAARRPVWESSGAPSEAGLSPTPLQQAPQAAAKKKGIPGFAGAFGRAPDSDSSDDDAGDTLGGGQNAAPEVPPLPASDTELSLDGVYGSNFAMAMLTRWGDFRGIVDPENRAVTGRQATVFAIQNTARQMEAVTSNGAASKDPAAILPSWRGFKFEHDLASPEQRRVIDEAKRALPSVDTMDARSLARSLAERNEAKKRFMASALHMTVSDKETARAASTVENETRAMPTAIHMGQLVFLAFVSTAVAVHGTRVPWMHATLTACGMGHVVPALAAKRFTDYTLHDVWTAVEAVRRAWKRLPLQATAGGSGPRLETWLRGMCHVLGVLLPMTLPAALVDGGSGAMLKAGHVVAVKKGATAVFLPSLWFITTMAGALVGMMRDVAGAAALVSRARAFSRFDAWTWGVVRAAHEAWGLPLGPAVSASGTARRTLSQSTAAVRMLCYLSSRGDTMVRRQLRHWSADCFDGLVAPGDKEGYVHAHPTCLDKPTSMEASVLFDQWPPPEDVLQEFVNELPHGPDAMSGATDVADTPYRVLMDVVADAYIAGGTSGAGDAPVLGDDEYVSRNRQWLAQRPREGGLLLLRALWSALSTRTGEDIYNGDNSLRHPCNLLASSLADRGMFDMAVSEEEEAADGNLPLWVVDMHAGWFVVVMRVGGTVRRTAPLLSNEVCTLLLCVLTTMPDANRDLLSIIWDVCHYASATVHPSRMVAVALDLGRRTPEEIAARTGVTSAPHPSASGAGDRPFQDADVVRGRLAALFNQDGTAAAERMAASEWTGITATVPPGEMRSVLDNRGLVPSVALVEESAARAAAHAVPVNLPGRASQALRGIETSRRVAAVASIKKRGRRVALAAASKRRRAKQRVSEEDADVGAFAERLDAVASGKAPAVITDADLDATEDIESYLALMAAKDSIDPFEALLREVGQEAAPGRVFQTAM